MAVGIAAASPVMTLIRRAAADGIGTHDRPGLFWAALEWLLVGPLRSDTGQIGDS